jgi:dUTP pyrophosphatase
MTAPSEEILQELKLKWQKLHPDAKAPVVAHPGEDLAYDLVAAEGAMLIPGRVILVRTGIAIEFTPAHGAIIKDRSSMAVKGIRTSAGVIDAGYRGEIRVPLTLDVNAPPSSDGQAVEGYRINAGDKIAQMIPVKPLTMFLVEEREALSEANRGGKGFGSTGK